MGFFALIAGVIILALVLVGAVAVVAVAGYTLLQVGIIALLGYGAYKAIVALKEKYGGGLPRMEGRRRHAFKGRTEEPRRPKEAEPDFEDVPVEEVRERASTRKRTASGKGRRDDGRARRDDGRARTDHAAYTHDYIYLDPEEPNAPDAIRQVMSAYLKAPVVGSYATSVQMTLDALAFRERSLLGEIDAKFVPGSLSWEKFHATAVTALDAVLRNCALLANRVQTFDEAEYERYEAFMDAGGFASNPHPGQAKLERWKLCSDTLQEMDEIRDVTDGLMTELGKLAAEISRLDSSKTPDDTRDIADEVSRLVDETKLYR